MNNLKQAIEDQEVDLKQLTGVKKAIESIFSSVDAPAFIRYREGGRWQDVEMPRESVRVYLDKTELELSKAIAVRGAMLRKLDNLLTSTEEVL